MYCQRPNAIRDFVPIVHCQILRTSSVKPCLALAPSSPNAF
jgi:hypothetical protein